MQWVSVSVSRAETETFACSPSSRMHIRKVKYSRTIEETSKPSRSLW